MKCECRNRKLYPPDTFWAGVTDSSFMGCRDILAGASLRNQPMVTLPRPAFVIAAFVLASAFPAFSQTSTPFAHVAFRDGAAALERDGNVEPLEIGMPILDGDRVRTTGRMELMFENGSKLYVDQASTLDVLSVDSLRLLDGGLRFDVSTGNRPYVVPIYRVDTPAGSVSIDAPGEYRISASAQPAATTLQVVRGTANLLSDNGGTTLRTGEQSTVRIGELPSFPARFNSARLDAFAQWIETRRNGLIVSVSQSYLPTILQPYAPVLDRYGSWTVDAQFGTVWYPTIGSGWRPYSSGRWTWVAQYGWTWVGTEAFAWPTHHYGRWCLNAVGSWFWIPGNSWGPAAPITALAGAATAPFGDFRDRFRAPGGFRDPGGFRARDGFRVESSVDRLRPRAPIRQAAPPIRPAVPPDPGMRSIPQPPIGLPHPPMGLPPLQPTMHASPSVGTAYRSLPSGGWSEHRSLQPAAPMGSAARAPAVAAPPQPAPRGPGSRGFSLTVPGAGAPVVPPAPMARPGPQFGTWGSIAPQGAAPK